MRQETLALVVSGSAKEGNVLRRSRIVAKRTGAALGEETSTMRAIWRTHFGSSCCVSFRLCV